MTSVFFTTIVICTMTGIVVITSGYLDVPGLDGGKLSNAAYNSGLPGNLGMYMVSIGLIFFAFTTIISWCYYGERCLVYLCKSVKWIFVYKVLYIACVGGCALSGTAAYLAVGRYHQCLYGLPESDRTFGTELCSHKGNQGLFCGTETAEVKHGLSGIRKRLSP